MILDTSAILGVLLREAEADRLLEALSKAPVLAVGAPTLVETSIVLGSRLGFERQAGILARFLQLFQLELLPFGEAHWHEAADAYRRFGKGKHPARLNYGDCLSYATASLAGQPLLCLGDDFPQTDLVLACF